MGGGWSRHGDSRGQPGGKKLEVLSGEKQLSGVQKNNREPLEKRKTTATKTTEPSPKQTPKTKKKEPKDGELGMRKKTRNPPTDKEKRRVGRQPKGLQAKPQAWGGPQPPENKE